MKIDENKGLTSRIVRSQNPAEAKKLSGRLMLTLSTKVSLLTILLVLAIPLFSIAQYPEQDLLWDFGWKSNDTYSYLNPFDIYF